MKKYIKSDAVSVEDEEYFDRLDLAENPATSPRVLARLYNTYDDSVRYRVWQNPNTPREILADAVYSKNHTWQMVVANNPNLPNDMYDHLVNHCALDVRKIARETRKAAQS